MSREQEKLAERIGQWAEKLKVELHKVIVGLDNVIENLITAILCQGHVMFMGVPGLAKTLLVSTLADALDLKFSRIQFTPDLMPSDITGTDVLEEDPSTGKKAFRFVPGPIFANIVLADEINRTTPKTQAATLQAMQERQVTASGRTYPLESPFHVFATQNPIEQDGTYPLPEAQLDRFMMEVHFPYPSWDEEKEIVRLTTVDDFQPVEKISVPEEILEYQKVVRHSPVPEHVIEYSVKIVRMMRPGDPSSFDKIETYVRWGPGPRASQFLVYAAKGRAFIRGEPVPSVSDVRAIAFDVLRHRLILNFKAHADSISPDDIIKWTLEAAGRV